MRDKAEQSDIESTREFKAKVEKFAWRTRRRVVFEVTIFFVLACYFWSDLSSELSDWLEISVLGVIASYVLIGLALYPKAKAAVARFSIRLSDGALGYPNQGHTKYFPYQDLKISKVKKKNGKVIEIRLRTTFGQTIQLRDLENMQELYAQLATHLTHES